MSADASVRDGWSSKQILITTSGESVVCLKARRYAVRPTGLAKPSLEKSLNQDLGRFHPFSKRIHSSSGTKF
jgi:hypothetical protein